MLTLANITDLTAPEYYLFLAISVFLFYIFGRSWVVISVNSILFYSVFSIKSLSIVLILTITAFILGRLLELRKSRILLWIGTGVFIGTLVYFRYTEILINGLNTLALGGANYLHVLAPVGISYIIFELVHYIVEIYKGGAAVKNILHFSLLPLFFPTVVAGPIRRYEKFLPQFSHSAENIRSNIKGFSLILRGVFKKVVIANSLAPFVASGFGSSADKGMAITAIYAFMFQIFFDFSGYTDIARGSAKLFGISIPENFNSPYTAESLREFWRRWHITLMDWLKDYIYVPLGGSRKKPWNTILNTIIVFTVSGLWHGPAGTFVFWGWLHGIGVSLSRIKLFKTRASTKIDTPRILSVLMTFHIVAIGWVFFRADSIEHAFDVLYRAASIGQWGQPVSPVLIYIFSIIIAYWLYGKIRHSLRVKFPELDFLYRIVVVGIVLMLILLNTAENPPQFIYAQF